MTEFIPIDHKDSDAEYRAEVRRGVKEEIGEPLLPVTDRSTIVGRWRLTFPRRKTTDMPAIYEFFADGTFTPSRNKPADAPVDKWRIEQEAAMVVTTWCPPMPDYGIPEGLYTEEAFHCALLASGGFVRWNGDGSLVQLFTPADNE